MARAKAQCRHIDTEAQTWSPRLSKCMPRPADHVRAQSLLPCVVLLNARKARTRFGEIDRPKLQYRTNFRILAQDNARNLVILGNWLNAALSSQAAFD
jgi:hypothetical protein